MAIYSKEDVANLGEQVFGTSFLPHPLPKYQFLPPQECGARTRENPALEIIRLLRHVRPLEEVRFTGKQKPCAVARQALRLAEAGNAPPPVQAEYEL